MSEGTWKETGTRKLVKVKISLSRTGQQKQATQVEYAVVNKRLKNIVRRDKRQRIDEQAQKAERRGNVKGLYNITKKLMSKGVRRGNSVKNKRRRIRETEGTFHRNAEDLHEGIGTGTTGQYPRINTHPPTSVK